MQIESSKQSMSPDAQIITCNPIIVIFGVHKHSGNNLLMLGEAAYLMGAPPRLVKRRKQ